MARSQHSSTSIAKKVYIVAGHQKSTKLDTIEVLDIFKDKEWHIFRVSYLTARVQPSVCPIDDSKLLIMCGKGRNYSYLADQIVIDI